ncbi:MAG TPA: hypothetical protein VMV94_12150 [Phycisphaerae bacterium]|nr:hypothetical protein [Phycisphaerae bacterium]
MAPAESGQISALVRCQLKPLTACFGHPRGPALPGHMVRSVCLCLLLSLIVAGCGRPETVEVDLSSSPARFIVDHAGWPRPFWWPRVTEFAIGSEEDDLLWQLQATSDRGELAHKLAFVYGQVPPGFAQVFPAVGTAPKPLIPGRSYFVGAVGPKAVYRAVFALPVSPEEAPHRRPGRQSSSDPGEPSSQPASSRPSRISLTPPPGSS